MIHELKTDRDRFKHLIMGCRATVRVNDRDFQVGDEIVFRETMFTGAEMAEGAVLEYSGRRFKATIAQLITGLGVQDGWVVIALEDSKSEVIRLSNLVAAHKAAFESIEADTVPAMTAHWTAIQALEELKDAKPVSGEPTNDVRLFNLLREACITNDTAMLEDIQGRYRHDGTATTADFDKAIDEAFIAARERRMHAR